MSATDASPCCAPDDSGCYDAVGLVSASIDWQPVGTAPADSSKGPSGGPDPGAPGSGGAPGGHPGKSCGDELPDSAGDPINVATGNMYHREVDFEYSGFLKMEKWHNPHRLAATNLDIAVL